MTEEPHRREEDSGALLSVVVPMFNEQENVDPFFERVEEVMRGLPAPQNESYEIICVDDGSSDGTVEKLLAHRRGNPAVRVICLSRNFGKDLAVTAGLEYAGGAAVIVIDV